ncbi:type II toxin-antitoxin system RelE/ParE family toxin [Rhizobium leguminosarum]|uniref:type II toxin-antitoxin system RelE/ParE family toxin n=1 Tax=Rhizobium TaxID=379 RepID=UPI001C8FF2A1|nr:MULTISPECIES: type II toxin-antitoxin system RelE/ParE family toxin [Rhizobium]MBY3050093.1 type II toxin-antitoxin system RelE/ParE family toxin [Rhizobium laguerreae]MBY5540464.1 type II toxin-antitoxin system RelE/ParE family toxin [Rhizobium leguminosarum]MBY5717562.1 type II toxin-antitoxin system RelE/ParE family toxin [Rhizobium leguminosarum]
MRIIWTETARRARQQATAYIAAQNRAAALDVLDEVSRQTILLRDHPEMGRKGRRQGTREFIISRTPFVVVYRYLPKSETIEILHFLHGAQQWPPKR